MKMKKEPLSPNFSQKPRQNKDIKFVIIHYTGMQSEIESIKRLKNTIKGKLPLFYNRKGLIIKWLRIIK